MGGCDWAMDLPAGVFRANFQHMARLGSPSLVLNKSAHSGNGVKHRIAHISPPMTLLLCIGCRGNFNQHCDNSLSVLLGVISSFVCRCNCSILIQLWVWHTALQPCGSSSLPPLRPADPSSWGIGMLKQARLC